MSKAVLVLDMPKKCEECQLAENQSGGYWYCNALHEYTTFIKFKESRPLKCPLRQMPEKKRMLVHMDMLADTIHALMR